MAITANRRIVLAELPTGRLTTGHFRAETTEAPTPGEGEVLLRTLYVSLDAAGRAWMQGPTYRSALKAGDVMAGMSLAEVVASNAPNLWASDLVFTETGWQEYATAPATRLAALPRVEPLSHLLSVFGIAGLTAYWGLLDCGRPQSGETVAVSAAAGSVGLVVGQIAKIKGCRVVGIAGGADKCATLIREFGFDAAVDYKAGDVRRALRAACPEGIDVYFDNVGGDIFEAGLLNMNMHGRVPCCGVVSQYDAGSEQRGPRAVPGLLVSKRLTLQGFIVMDYDDRRTEALADLKSWVADGRLKVREDILHGLDSLPAGLVGLLAGENIGKRMAKIA